jgi:hypothetical protein
MRLVYRRDHRGHLVEAVDGGVPGTPEASAPTEGGVATLPEAEPEEELWLDEDFHMRALEEGEPGARRTRPEALVVDEDPDMRLVLRRVLEAEGYAVSTCPGPRATHCRAARSGARAAPVCPRVPRNTRVVLLDEVARSTRLPEAYRTWLPEADILETP